MWSYLEILILLTIATLIITQLMAPIAMDTQTWWLFRKKSVLKELEEAEKELERAKLEKEAREIKKETRETDNQARPSMWD